MDTNQIYRILAYVCWAGGGICGIITIALSVKYKIFNVIKSLTRNGNMVTRKYDDNTKQAPPVRQAGVTSKISKRTSPLTKEITSNMQGETLASGSLSKGSMTSRKATAVAGATTALGSGATTALESGMATASETGATTALVLEQTEMNGYGATTMLSSAETAVLSFDAADMSGAADVTEVAGMGETTLLTQEEEFKIIFSEIDIHTNEVIE